jgi:adenylate kinase
VKERIVLLGPPASGKGTQAELIEARFGIPITSPGAMLRAEKKAGTPLGVEADKLTSAGKLLPDDLVVRLVEGWLLQTQGRRFTFDGFPRSLGQAEALERMLAERDAPLDVVLALEANVATLQERVANRVMCLQCGNIAALGWQVKTIEEGCPRCGGALVRRNDDTPETLAQRLREYSEKTEPLFAFYEERQLLHRIDSAQSAEMVFARISEILEER